MSLVHETKRSCKPSWEFAPRPKAQKYSTKNRKYSSRDLFPFQIFSFSRFRSFFVNVFFLVSRWWSNRVRARSQANLVIACKFSPEQLTHAKWNDKRFAQRPSLSLKIESLNNHGPKRCRRRIVKNWIKSLSPTQLPKWIYRAELKFWVNLKNHLTAFHSPQI